MEVIVKKLNAEKNVVTVGTQRKEGRVFVEVNYWLRAVDLADWTLGATITLTTGEVEGLHEIE